MRVRVRGNSNSKIQKFLKYKEYINSINKYKNIKKSGCF